MEVYLFRSVFGLYFSLINSLLSTKIKFCTLEYVVFNPITQWCDLCVETTAVTHYDI